MAIIRKKEMREMDDVTLEKKLGDLKSELYSELGFIAAGGKASNPGRIREIRKTIARILTLRRERAGKSGVAG